MPKPMTKIGRTTKIDGATINDKNSHWKIVITDLVAKGARFHLNHNSLNFEKKSRDCKFKNCKNKIKINRTSGLCNEHQTHKHSLFLEIYDSSRKLANAPQHSDI